MTNYNILKKIFFLLLFTLFLVIFSACCIDTDTKTAVQPSQLINNTTQCNLSDEWISGVNVSTVSYLGSESIRTNASFVTRIALCDKNVKEMLSHGSDIKGVLDFMPSRPKGWNKSSGPTLWVDYRGIDVYFYVNETGQYVERYEIVVPGYLYGKERLENYTRLYDGNGTAFAFNSSKIWFPT